MNQITVTIPATTANLGSGFDCLGLALQLYNETMFTAVSKKELIITVSGVDAEKIPTDSSNLVAKSAEFLFERLGKRPAGLHIHQQNNIPVGSGLGSSSTAILAGLFGANGLSNGRLTPKQILDIATELEGHPDNVAPAVYGNLVLGISTENGLHVESFKLPEMKVIIVLPDFHLLTSEARAALPEQIDRADAIFNMSRIGLLIRALETAVYDKLAIAMQDKLHQPYRIPLIPGMAAAFVAAKAAGAAAVALSGAGPSLVAFAPHNHEAIAQAALNAFAEVEVNGRYWILPIDTKGAVIHQA